MGYMKKKNHDKLFIINKQELQRQSNLGNLTYLYAGLVGEYAGLVGLYCGDVGE